MNFALPSVPSNIELEVDAEDVLGEIILGSDEVITSKPASQTSTKLNVEGSGGSFTLRWGNRRSTAENIPLLEVESRVDVQWDSPQDQPLASVRLTIRNIKGSISRFRLALPPGSVLLDSPRLGAGGRSVDFIPITSSSDASKTRVDGDWVEVVIPEEEQQQRIDLNFDLQLAGGEITSENPLKMVVPHVIDSLRHRGELSLRVGGDYRLRWEARPWIRGEPVESSVESASGRLYRFRYDRGSFELPVWLSTNERRLRLSARSEVTIRDAVASLKMQINIGGSIADNQLRFDDAAWEVISIENQQTGQKIESFLSGQDRVIELSNSGSEENLVLELAAERSIGLDLGDIEFPLPRILSGNEDVTMEESTLDLIGSGRTLLTVDLAASEGLSRIMTSETENALGSIVSRFRLANFDEPVLIAGTLQDQPVRIDLAAEATVELDGSQILSNIDWTVTSPLDLEGRLPIRIPLNSGFIKPDLSQPVSRTFPDDTATSFGDPDVSENSRGAFGSLFGDRSGTDGTWIVTVGGVPATLRKLENDRYELISERLSSGTLSIRWRHTQEVVSQANGMDAQEVSLPRPGIPDVTIRGVIEVSLRGDGRTDLVAVDSSDDRQVSLRDAGSSSPLSDTLLPEVKWRNNMLTLDSLPREPLRLRLRSQQSSVQDLSIEQLVIRSAVGHRTRHEQVLATIRRGSEFRVRVAGLPIANKGLSINQAGNNANTETENGSTSVEEASPAANSQVALDPYDGLVVEAKIDGQSVPVENHSGSLVVMLPEDQQEHSLQLSVWVPEDPTSSVVDVRPIIQLPGGMGRVFWQIITPLDSHVIWASPTVGRSMSWEFGDWNLYRQASMSDLDLIELVHADSNDMPPGNRYLYVGTDLPAFEVVIASRTVLWMAVGSFVLLLSTVLTYFPASRHPLTAVFIAVAFIGLMVVAPDAAVLAGQLGLISLVLVIVMMAVRSLLIPGQNDRVFVNSTKTIGKSPSTNDIPAKNSRRAGGISETQTAHPSTHSPSGAEIVP